MDRQRSVTFCILAKRLRGKGTAETFIGRDLVTY